MFIDHFALLQWHMDTHMRSENENSFQWVLMKPFGIIHSNEENVASPYLRLSVRLKRFLQMSQVNRFGRGK